MCELYSLRGLGLNFAGAPLIAPSIKDMPLLSSMSSINSLRTSNSPPTAPRIELKSLGITLIVSCIKFPISENPPTILFNLSNPNPFTKSPGDLIADIEELIEFIISVVSCCVNPPNTPKSMLSFISPPKSPAGEPAANSPKILSSFKAPDSCR